MDAIASPHAPSAVSPVDWPWAASHPPVVSSETTAWRGALLRSWRGTSPVMVQPPLDHHYIVMHLGGAKRVNRMRDGPPLTTIAETHAMTIVPAGTAYRWKTDGPIAFAHLYLHPDAIERFRQQVLERDGGAIELVDRVGFRDHWLEPIFRRMLEEVQFAPRPSQLRLDSLLESFCVRLLRQHVSVPSRPRSTRAESLAPHRLRRVLDFIDAHLGDDMALADLVGAAGTSQFHFSRAFHAATGRSPYRYVLDRRIELARVLLIAQDASLDAISATCGFNSRRQFTLMFRRSVGVSPHRFRTSRRS